MGDRVTERAARSTESREDDPRLAFVYQEAVRGLTHQQGVVESLNARAGNLVFAAAFATSLLGTRALSDGVGIWDWAATALLFAVGALVAFMLWPFYNYTFRFEPSDLLRRYVDGGGDGDGDGDGASLSAMHRSLALRIERDMANNWRVIQRIRIALQVGLVCLLLEIATWMLAISSP
jgi:hypothetical protein